MSEYDVFTNIEQVGTRGVRLCVSHNLHASPLEQEASHLSSESVLALVNFYDGDTPQIASSMEALLTLTATMKTSCASSWKHQIHRTANS